MVPSQKGRIFIINKKYKDRLFRKIFNNKKDLLSLYNAINESNYDNPDELEIVTLEDALYLSMKNDLSFIISCELNLFEHQSTISPNMPLRGFLYFAAHYKAIAEKAGFALYSTKLLKIPVPRYIVFYNGTDPQPERQELKLSAAFEKNDIPGCLECTATVLNINIGYNKSIQNACKTLRHYATLVQEIRNNYSKNQTLEESVNSAVTYCIENDILSDFLRKNQAEVLDLIFTSYDEEAHMEFIRQETREEMQEEIDKIQEELKKKEDALRENEAALSEKDAALNEKDAALSEKDALIKQLREELEQLKKG